MVQFAAGTPPGARLVAGSIWSLDGIRCTIATKTVTCKDRSGHGFTVSSTSYKNF
ncbi:MAG: hypothetical protein ACLPZR_01970 [Solirubrobacteraceae bacterium]